jgi:hypothetical protein
MSMQYFVASNGSDVADSTFSTETPVLAAGSTDEVQTAVHSLYVTPDGSIAPVVPETRQTVIGNVKRATPQPTAACGTPPRPIYKTIVVNDRCKYIVHAHTISHNCYRFAIRRLLSCELE